MLDTHTHTHTHAHTHTAAIKFSVSCISPALGLRARALPRDEGRARVMMPAALVLKSKQYAGTRLRIQTKRARADAAPAFDADASLQGQKAIGCFVFCDVLCVRMMYAFLCMLYAIYCTVALGLGRCVCGLMVWPARGRGPTQHA